MAFYTAKQAAQMLGISVYRLRIWEQRYHTASPRRTASGHRLYSEEEIEHLRKLVTLVARGHRISNLIGLTETELAKLLKSEENAPPPPADVPREPADFWSHLTGALQSLRAGRLKELTSELVWAGAALNGRDFVLHLVEPIAREARRAAEEGRLSAGQLRSVMALLREPLAAMGKALQRSARGKRPCILVIAPKGLETKLDVLCHGVLAAFHARTIELREGRASARAIAAAATKHAATTVLLLTDIVDKTQVETTIRELDRLLPSGCTLATRVATTATSARLRVVRSLAEWESYLREGSTPQNLHKP